MQGIKLLYLLYFTYWLTYSFADHWPNYCDYQAFINIMICPETKLYNYCGTKLHSGNQHQHSSHICYFHLAAVVTVKGNAGALHSPPPMLSLYSSPLVVKQLL